MQTEKMTIIRQTNIEMRKKQEEKQEQEAYVTKANEEVFPGFWESGVLVSTTSTVQYKYMHTLQTDGIRRRQLYTACYVFLTFLE